MPTSDIGVFEVISDSETKVAKIDGELVYNGTVELAPGETEVEWVAGQQPEKPVEEEKTEIKLTIGKAEITTNGEAKALDVPAQIIDSRTMVPLRAIFEALGASVEWDDATKTVTSVKGDTTVKLTIGQASINVNGADKALDVPAQIVDSRTLVPVRAIAESFGCEVGWDDPTKTVTITK
ncbi:MAG: copper amine oxidase N-terminal domain-containing protein [Clostridia bacterium]|nr:copper amine oxidase N-terminal domain-containing protein [Clostridia bacterium]